MIERERHHLSDAPLWVRAKATVDYVLGWTVALLLGLSVVNVLWQVVTRFILQAPSAFTDELARFLLIWIGLLGGTYAVGKQLHLAIDLLPQKLKGRASSVLTIIIKSIVLLFALSVLVIGGIRLVYIVLTLEQASAALQIPLGYVYMVLPLSGVLIVYYCATFIYEHIRVLRGKTPLLLESGRTSAEALTKQVEPPPDNENT